MSAPAEIRPIGIVGLGKIARDQHIPAIHADPTFTLAACVSPVAADPPLPGYPELPGYRDIAAMVHARPDIQAVAICTPPSVRFDLARHALQAGRHVLLEKPPGVTLDETRSLRALAAAQQRTVFAAWHARETPAVDAARAWLAARRLTSARIVWKEDVRRWHPGQDWVWADGAIGVFDAGINAVSILTRLLDERINVRAGALYVPANRQSPIAATVELATERGAAIHGAFDWRQTGAQTWDIELVTDDGVALLSDGGGRLEIDGRRVSHAPADEYPRLYRVFASLINSGQTDLDDEPLRLIADVFRLGARHQVEPFHDQSQGGSP